MSGITIDQDDGHDDKRIYCVYGSGLMPVPFHMINEIPRLKAEYHSNEVSLALAAARTRKIA